MGPHLRLALWGKTMRFADLLRLLKPHRQVRSCAMSQIVVYRSSPTPISMEQDPTYLFQLSLPPTVRLLAPMTSVSERKGRLDLLVDLMTRFRPVSSLSLVRLSLLQAPVKPPSLTRLPLKYRAIAHHRSWSNKQVPLKAKLTDGIGR